MTEAVVAFLSLCAAFGAEWSVGVDATNGLCSIILTVFDDPVGGRP